MASYFQIKHSYYTPYPENLQYLSKTINDL